MFNSRAWMLMAFILGCLSVTPVLAGPGPDPDPSQYGPPGTSHPPPTKPGCNCGPKPLQNGESAADPIHVHTGNVYREQLIYRGGGRFPFSFSFHYNSRILPDATNSNFRGEWSYDYGQSLRFVSGNPNLVILYDSTGRQVTFEQSGSSYVLTLRNQSVAQWGALELIGTTYKYTSPNEVSYYFDSTGALLKVQSQSGELQTLTRQTVGGSNQITVTNDYGKNIVIRFSATNPKLPVSFIDPDGVVYQFDWITAASIPELSDVTYPDYSATGDSVVTFHYLTTEANPAADWLYSTALVSVTDEEGWQEQHWSYSDDGYGIQNYQGNDDEKTNVIDVKSVNQDYLEHTGDMHSAYVTNPYGCKLVYYHHSYVAGQQFVVNTWLNYIKGADADTGCGMIGTIMRNSYFPGQNDWEVGGLIVGGMPNRFEDNLFEERAGWDSTLRKHKIRRSTSLNSDGLTKTTIEQDVYQYNNDLRMVSHVDRYAGTDTTPWRSVDFTYDEFGAGFDLYGHLKSKTVTDLKLLPSSPYNTYGEQRTWNYNHAYYDSEGRALEEASIQDPRGYMSSSHYTPEGYLDQTTDQAGHSIQYSNFTGRGNAQTIVDINGVTTQRVFNDRGWLLSSTRAGETTQYDYYKNGLLKRITAPGGNWTEYTYNSARVLTQITQSNGDKQAINEVMDRDVTHQKTVTREWFRSGSATPARVEVLVYDALARLIHQNSAPGAQTDYYYEDSRFSKKVTRMVVEGDANTPDREYRYQYNQNGWLAAEFEPGNTSTTPDVTYNREDQGNLTEVTDANGLTTHYLYDGFNQLIQQTSPDTGTTIYDYDADGNLIDKIDANGTEVRYSYDALNRVTAVTYPYNLGQNITYTYDLTDYGSQGIGHLGRVEDASGSTEYRYDTTGQITAKITTIQQHRYIWTYSYDSAGRLQLMHYPSGRQVRYVWDAVSGRLQAVYTRAWEGAPEHKVADNFSYLPFGSASGWTFGNGITSALGYDQGYRLTSINYAGNNPISEWTLTPDAAGNIRTITDQLDNTQSQSFSYDYQGRLQTALGPYGWLHYSYDANGNRLTTDRNPNGGQTPTSTTSYNYVNPFSGVQDSNRLWSLNSGQGDELLNYDADGNLTQKDNTTFYYNAASRLETVTSTTNTVSYLYNAFGQRVAKITSASNAANRHYHYNEAGQLLAEYDGDGRVVSEYIYGNGRLLAVAMPDPSADSDGDGMDDDWERQYFGDLSHDGTQDSDNDGISDLNEFISGTDPTTNSNEGPAFTDSDGDGLPDSWEIAFFGDLSQTASGDFDGDGYSNMQEYLDGSDPTDNRSAGKLNADEDGDGMLDQWEFYYFGTMAHDGTADTDGDGFTDLAEFQDGTDPTNKYSGGKLGADSDGDGLPDRWEVKYFGNLNQDAASDFDNDYIKNIDEYKLGYDPTKNDVYLLLQLINE